MFFFKNHVENELGRLVLDVSLFFKKVLYEVKQVTCSLVSIYIDSLQLVNLACNKTNCRRL